MAPPCRGPFAIIRTGNPTSGYSGSAVRRTLHMQFRRHPCHDDPTLRREELDDDDDIEDDDDDDDDSEDDDPDDVDDDEDDDDEDFDEDDDGCYADTTAGQQAED